MNSPNGPVELHDIHGPIALVGPAGPWLYLAIGLLVLILLAALAWWYYRRRPKEPQVVILPGARAMQRLEEARHLRQSAQALAYLTEVSVILRQYIEGQFQIPFTKQTTAEFFTWLQRDLSIPEPLLLRREELRQCLELCDLGKYAHRGVGITDMVELERAILTFIEQSQQEGGQQPAASPTGGK